MRVQGLSFGVRRLVAAFARRDSSRRTFAPVTSHRLQKAGTSSRTPKTRLPVRAPALDGQVKAITRGQMTSRGGGRSTSACALGCKLTRAVLQMENFHKFRRFVHAVIYQDGGMDQLAYSWTPLNQAADVRETLEELNVIKYGVAEPLGAGGKVGPRIGEDENLLTRLL